MAKGTATVLANGGTAAIKLPFQPDYVEFLNYTAMTTPTATWIAKGYWDVNMGQGAAAFDSFNVTPVATSGTTLVNGISTFSAGQAFQFGATKQIVSITKANPAVVTVTAHGYSSGDVVVFQGLFQVPDVSGMQQIAGIPFTITVIDANSFSIPFNTNQTNFTALTLSPAGALVKKALFPYLYAPGSSIISAITLGTTTTVVTTTAHNFVVGQEVAFHIPSTYGTTGLNTLPNTVTPGSPVYGYVIAVTDYATCIVNINSTGMTPFNTNQPFNNFPGQQFAQIAAVGDVNTGGVQISAGSQLYPPPFIRPFANDRVNTINGPAIQGAFFNNTSQGFIIGTALALPAQAGQIIYWRAMLHDMSVPV